MNNEATNERLPGLRRFKPYPAYKDSGVEWLAEVPAHWDVARIGELRRLRKMTCTSWANSVPCAHGRLAGIPGAAGDLVATPE